MSEFSEGYAVSKLLGSAPGYVGYRETAKLTDTIKQKPHAVILFDEFEKAHPDVHNLLLQILDEGSLTDAAGQTINFNNSLIILTTNAAKERFDGGQLGFETTSRTGTPAVSDLRPTLEEQFKPELLNRLSQIIVFNRLQEKDLLKVIRKDLQQLNHRLKPKGFSLKATPDVAKTLVKQLNPKLGAREVRRTVEQVIEKPLAQLLLNRVGKNKTYQVHINKEGQVKVK
jgi:ATP-dependent Clp protease ATP-binding subunit ClpA